MKRVVILLAALYGAETFPGMVHAQQAPTEAAIIAVAQPAVGDLLTALPANTTLKPTQVFVDDIGQAHVRLAQFYKSVPVFEGDAIIHIDLASNQVIGTTNATLPFAPIAVTPSVSSTRAAEAARTHFAQPLGLTSKKDLAILVKDGSASLAWMVHSEGAGNSSHIDTIAFVGSNNARLLRAWNNLHSGAVNGTANGMYTDRGGKTITVDQVTGYALRNPNAPIFYTCDMQMKTNGQCPVFVSSTPTFGTGSLTTTGPTAAADAQFGAQMTLDFYKTAFGRNGINNAGMTTYSRVHYGRSYQNAFWSDSCSCMTYGDGASTFYPLVSLDIAGHEMSHGVTARTANLTYSGESGGLNEATSDIFGTMVEYHAKGTYDVPDYKIGEMIYKSNWSSGTFKGDAGTALRFMYDPAKDGASQGCWYSGVGSLDVHYSSGIANHFFYLLAEGSSPTSPLPKSPVCGNADNVTLITGIGKDAAAKIWYRALTTKMTSSTNYAGARQATVQAAIDLYGANSTEAAATAAAWSAVNVTKPAGKL